MNTTVLVRRSSVSADFLRLTLEIQEKAICLHSRDTPRCIHSDKVGVMVLMHDRYENERNQISPGERVMTNT